MSCAERAVVVRILVVDDDSQILRAVRSYLEQSGYQVLVANQGQQALQIIRRERLDLVILDLMLPDVDGWDLIRIVRSDENLTQLPVIMLTARVGDNDKILGLELGADDYVTKPFNPREVVARVRAVLRRSNRAPALSQMLEAGPLVLSPGRHLVTLRGEEIELTPTEFELLKVLMENPGHTFTRLELLDKALGYAFVGIERTVDSHIKNLRRKIEADPANPTYIRTVFGVGYRFEADEL